MSINANSAARKAEIEQVPSDARKLADLGVPFFLARLDRQGNPIPPRGWQNTEPGDPSHTAIDAWKPGLALCAVTGVVFDVLDIDPRNGGRESFEKLDGLLGDAGPVVYGRVATPSGGHHLWIAGLGIRKLTGLLPGIDLQCGDTDGEGRGFVFMPPTVRPSKVTGELAAYRWLRRISPQSHQGVAVASAAGARRSAPTPRRPARVAVVARTRRARRARPAVG